MADLNIRFPPKISLNAVGGPGFLTSGGAIPIMASGAESRTQDWELERGQWVVSHHARVPADWEPLLAFIRVVAGMANTFRFKDWTDYICAAGSGFFVDALGSPSRMQMVKRYSFPTLTGGTVTYDRYITKPIDGTVTVTGGGTVDYATGLVEGGSPSAWHGEFDCWCRLNSDIMKAQVITRSLSEGLLVGWDNIEIVEVTNEVTA